MKDYIVVRKIIGYQTLCVRAKSKADAKRKVDNNEIDPCGCNGELQITQYNKVLHVQEDVKG